jgi:hypothetical protein
LIPWEPESKQVCPLAGRSSGSHEKFEFQLCFAELILPNTCNNTPRPQGESLSLETPPGKLPMSCSGIHGMAFCNPWHFFDFWNTGIPPSSRNLIRILQFLLSSLLNAKGLLIKCPNHRKLANHWLHA